MHMLFLKSAYILNIFILAPVLVAMYRDKNATSLRAFQGTVKNSEGLRLLVASLWSAILLLSIAGINWPKSMIPVLMLQVIYKSLFLLTYCLPRLKANRFDELPIGLSISFLFIVIAYPPVIIIGINGH